MLARAEIAVAARAVLDEGKVGGAQQHQVVAVFGQLRQFLLGPAEHLDAVKIRGQG